MFTLLLVFVVVLALFAVMNLTRGPGFGRRRNGRVTIIERERPTVVEREYDA
jgi:hypothetical protein